MTATTSTVRRKLRHLAMIVVGSTALVLLLGPTFNGDQSAPAQAPPQAEGPAEVMTIIASNGVEVRSGPSASAYATSILKNSDSVKVLPRFKKGNPGWLAIEPPPGSQSWIKAEFVQRSSKENPNQGVVTCAEDSPTPIKPGSKVYAGEPDRESTRVSRGTPVVILDVEKIGKDGTSWLPVQPPAGDVRYIPESAVSNAGRDQNAAAPQVQKPEGLDKTKAHLAKVAAEVQALQQKIDLLRAELEERQAALALGQRALIAVERHRALKVAVQNLESKKAAEEGATVRVPLQKVEAGSTVEKRLSDMERKLDEVLKELRDLRKSMAGGLTPQTSKFSPIGGAWPEKLFQRKPTFDFGKVEQSTRLKHSFPIKNIFAVPLEITEVHVSNGALSAVPTKKKLEPKEEASLDVVMNTKGLTGATDVTVYVLIGPAFIGTAELHLLANVEK